MGKGSEEALRNSEMLRVYYSMFSGLWHFNFYLVHFMTDLTQKQSCLLN